MLASSGDDDTVRLWGTRGDGVSSRTLQRQKTRRGIGGVAYSGDGRLLASVVGRTIRMWDTRGYRELRRPLRTDFSVTAIAFTAGSRRLVSLSTRGGLQLAGRAHARASRGCVAREQAGARPRGQSRRSHGRDVVGAHDLALGPACTQAHRHDPSAGDRPTGLGGGRRDQSGRQHDRLRPLPRPGAGVGRSHAQAARIGADGPHLQRHGGGLQLGRSHARVRRPGPDHQDVGRAHRYGVQSGRCDARDGRCRQDRPLWEGIFAKQLRDEICDLVGTGLTRAEWQRFATDVPYRRSCA